MTEVRESVVLVMEYLMGQLNLTDFPRLLYVERYTFSPKGHTADFLATLHEQVIADKLKLADLDHAD